MIVSNVRCVRKSKTPCSLFINKIWSKLLLSCHHISSPQNKLFLFEHFERIWRMLFDTFSGVRRLLITKVYDVTIITHKKSIEGLNSTLLVLATFSLNLISKRIYYWISISNFELLSNMERHRISKSNTFEDKITFSGS